MSAIIGDSSKVELNLDEASSLQDVQDLLNQCRFDRIANPNERIFHTLIDSIYFLLTSSHSIAEEKKAYKDGRRYNTIWYPVKDQSKRMIIVEYNYLKETESISVKASMTEAHFQIFEKGSLQPVLRRYTKLKLGNIEEVEIRPVVIVEGRGNSKTILHWPHRPYVLTIFQTFLVDDFARNQSEAQWIEIKKGGIERFYEEALLDDPLEVYVSDEPSVKFPSSLSIEQEELKVLHTKRRSDVLVALTGEAQKRQKRESNSSSLTMEQEKLSQKLLSEAKGPSEDNEGSRVG